MNRCLVAAVVAGAMLAVLPVLVISSSADPPRGPCGSPSDGAVVTTAPAADLNATQVHHAATVIAVGKGNGIPDRGIVVALATALQESRLRVYGNDGVGADLAADQHGITASLRLPHDAVGSDHGSLGLFQQQWPWWGRMRELMDPAASARLFYAALRRVPGWSTMSVTRAAQAVQRSAYPAAYADDEPLARRLLHDLAEPATETGADLETATETSSGGGGGGMPGWCAAAWGAGLVRFPLPRGSGYVDRENFGNHGSRWSARHTGTDLSVSCGTPVLAATSGGVRIQTDQSWAGRWLVQVSTGPGRLSTWYAHMRRVDVVDGARVRAGQPIGEVGDLGNATGCHLHFEVRPSGGTIYQDPVDPTHWLHDHVGKPLQRPGGQGGPSGPGGPGGLGLRGPASTAAAGVGEGSDLVVASFNTLGASHTAPGGKHPRMASGATRTRWAVRLLDAHAVDVVGLQEFQPPQRLAFQHDGGDTYATWSPRGDTENSVAWRRSTLELVSASTVRVPYFDGHPRRMPVVRLRVRATGQEFYLANFHNPADTARYHRQGRWRARATSREVELAARLGRSHVPVLVTGDMNESGRYFCRFTASRQMSAAAGGSHPGRRCLPPTRAGIDWIFGSRRGVRFRDYVSDRSRAVQRTTDHPVVLTRARLTRP